MGFALRAWVAVALVCLLFGREQPAKGRPLASSTRCTTTRARIIPKSANDAISRSRGKRRRRKQAL